MANRDGHTRDDSYNTDPDIEYRMRRIELALLTIQLESPLYLGIIIDSREANQQGKITPCWDDRPGIDWSKPVINT